MSRLGGPSPSPWPLLLQVGTRSPSPKGVGSTVLCVLCPEQPGAQWARCLWGVNEPSPHACCHVPFVPHGRHPLSIRSRCLPVTQLSGVQTVFPGPWAVFPSAKPSCCCGVCVFSPTSLSPC